MLHTAVALLFIACCAVVDCSCTTVYVYCLLHCCTCVLPVALLCCTVCCSVFAASLPHGACLLSFLIPIHNAGLAKKAQFSLHGLGFAHKAECTISCRTHVYRVPTQSWSWHVFIVMFLIILNCIYHAHDTHDMRVSCARICARIFLTNFAA